MIATYNGIRVQLRDEKQREQLIEEYSRVVLDDSRAKPTRNLAQQLVWAFMQAKEVP